MLLSLFLLLLLLLLLLHLPNQQLDHIHGWSGGRRVQSPGPRDMAGVRRRALHGPSDLSGRWPAAYRRVAWVRQTAG